MSGERMAVRGWHRLAVIAASVCVGMAAAQLIVRSMQRQRPANAATVDDLFATLATFRVEVRVAFVAGALAALCSLLALMVLLVAGLRRASEVEEAVFPPGWALWCWLVPGLNLVLPPLVVAQVLASGQAAPKTPGASGRLVWGWWLSGLAFVAYASYRWLTAPDGGGTSAALVEGSQRPGPDLVAVAVRAVDGTALIAPDVWALGLLLLAAACLWVPESRPSQLSAGFVGRYLPG